MKLNISHIIVILIVFMVSCSDSSSDFCLSNQMSVKSSFYSFNSSTSETDRDTSIAKLRIRGIYPDRSVHDSIVSDTVSASFAYFPLSMHSDSTEFRLEIDKRENQGENIIFYTQKELAYVSEECGFIFNFHIDSFKYTVENFIDTIIIEDRNVIYSENTDNVKIYFYN